MNRVIPWVRDHAWTSTISAFVVGLLLGVGPSSDPKTVNTSATSAQSSAAEVAAEMAEAESANAGLETENARLESEVVDLENELERMEAKLSLINSRQPLPTLVGLARAKLEKIAASNGWTVIYRKQVSSAVPPGAVLSQDPAPGATVHSGSVIRIVIAKAPPPPPQESSSSSASTGSGCTPGYDPCLPPASDYDCAGGSGDGPKYTGPVRVTGSDPYGLDSDGDGYGCES